MVVVGMSYYELAGKLPDQRHKIIERAATCHHMQAAFEIAETFSKQQDTYQILMAKHYYTIAADAGHHQSQNKMLENCDIFGDDNEGRDILWKYGDVRNGNFEIQKTLIKYLLHTKIKTIEEIAALCQLFTENGNFEVMNILKDATGMK